MMIAMSGTDSVRLIDRAFGLSRNGPTPGAVPQAVIGRAFSPGKKESLVSRCASLERVWKGAEGLETRAMSKTRRNVSVRAHHLASIYREVPTIRNPRYDPLSPSNVRTS